MSSHQRVEIQPETMHPALTRGGLDSFQRLRIEGFAHNLGDFLQTNSGILLPPSGVVTRYQQLGSERLRSMADRSQIPRIASEIGRLSSVLTGSKITDNGCLVNRRIKPDNLGLYLTSLAEKDWGSPAFDGPNEIDEIRLCDCEECLNTRHYDFEFSRPTLRERRTEFDIRFYTKLPSGEIETIWGDVLPRPDISLAEFWGFVKKCYPYVSYEKSVLSPTSVSQIRFIQQTGCWESWQYYTKPDNGLNWQYDGYGRLNNRFKVKHINPETGEIFYKNRVGHMLAHRVVWGSSGRRLLDDCVVNHLCGYKICCNPLHLEQVKVGHNTAHAKKMHEAIRALDQK